MPDSDAGYRTEWHYFSRDTFGRFLKSQRAARGISRSRLASVTEIKETRLASLEANAVMPTYGEIRKLSAALGMREESLLAAAGYLNRQQRRD